MTTLADLLNPDDRQRLAEAATRSEAAELADAARDAAAESTGVGVTAWTVVADALDATRDTAQAHEILTLAVACLGVLTNDNTTSTETP